MMEVVPAHGDREMSIRLHTDPLSYRRLERPADHSPQPRRLPLPPFLVKAQPSET
jgi:hypothetical protein